MLQKIAHRIFDDELKYSFTRSSGPGGQHVNKVSTRVELRWNIPASIQLSEEEKLLVLERLSAYTNNEGECFLNAQESRSQSENKEIVREKFYKILSNAFKPVKKRIPTKPSKASKAKRIESKKKTGQKKEQRRKPDLD